MIQLKHIPIMKYYCKKIKSRRALNHSHLAMTKFIFTLVSSSSGVGLLPEVTKPLLSTKPLPEPVVTYDNKIQRNTIQSI